MSIKLLYSEKFFIVLIASAAIIFNLLPYIRQYQLTSPDKTYIGSYPIIYDKAVYLSVMTQGEERNWKIINKYTTEPQEKAFVYPLYVSMGYLSRITNVSPETIFLIGRFAFGLILLIVVVYFIRYFVRGENQRKLAYFLAFFSSELGWIISDEKSIDYWIPDAIPMIRFSYFPHFMLANALLLATVLLIYHVVNNKGGRKLAIAAGILSFGLNLVLPFTGILSYLLIASILLIRFLKDRIIEKDALKNILVFFAISLPSLLYMYYVGISDPIWKMVEKQNILPTPPLINLISGYGTILAFSFCGIGVLLKEERWKGLFFSVWILAVFALAYTPMWIYPMQRRFLETAFYAPLAITASFGIRGIYRYLEKKHIKYLYWKFAVFFGVFIIPFILTGNLANWLQFNLILNQKDTPWLYLPNENIDAMRWLKKNSPPDTVVLANLYDGNVAPYYASRKVYMGHGPMTINIEEKLQKSEDFFSGKYSDDKMFEFLKKERINYIFYSGEERKMGNFNPEEIAGLKLVYSNDKAKIYKVE